MRRRRRRRRSSRATSACSSGSATGAFVPLAKPLFLRDGLLQGFEQLRLDRHPGGVVVGPGHGGVHAYQAEVHLTTRGGLGDHRFHQRLEDPGPGPEVEPPVDGGPGPVPLGHVPPRTARTEPPHHAVDEPAQVGNGAAFAQRQQRFEHGPLVVREITPGHPACLPSQPRPDSETANVLSQVSVGRTKL